MRPLAHRMVESNQLDTIIEEKLRKSPGGKLKGYGLVILPKEKKPTPATQ